MPEKWKKNNFLYIYLNFDTQYDNKPKKKKTENVLHAKVLGIPKQRMVKF